MKNKQIKIMDEADERFSVLLQEFGYSAKESKVLVFMLGRKESVSKEIEQATGLRQPEVSIGTKGLLKAGLLKAEAVKNDKKGRPHFKFVTTLNITEFVKDAQKKLNEKIERMKGNLKELEDTLEKLGE